MAHIASDGPGDWTIETPSRDDVLARMARAIERWNLNTTRNINYRSFEPILGLVRCYETPECQHWAVWALANLTKVSKCFTIFIIFFFYTEHTMKILYFYQVYPSKYCRLVEDECGLGLLRDLIQHHKPNERIKELARMVISNCLTSKSSEAMQLDG